MTYDGARPGERKVLMQWQKEQGSRSNLTDTLMQVCNSSIEKQNVGVKEKITDNMLGVVSSGGQISTTVVRKVDYN